MIRGNNIESKHAVYAVAIDGDGKIIFSTGDPEHITCIRSALKPFQAAAAVSIGATTTVGFNEKELALMCASHNGEKVHVQIAKNMAYKLCFDETYYECGSHTPYDKESRNATHTTGYSVFHNNCSGKHSGMLAIAKELKVNPKNYTLKNHPVQTTIFKYLSQLIGKKTTLFGVDGCSAPTPFLPIIEIAKLFQLLGSSNHSELLTTYRAMKKHPYLIAGKNRFDTDFISTLKGRGLTKVGGEAVRGAIIKTEQYGLVGIAQKVLDGNQRANESAIMKIFNHLEILTPDEQKKLNKYITKKQFNHKNIYTGDIKAVLV